MKRIIPNVQQFIFLLLFFVFSVSVNAQPPCNITGIVSSSTYSCTDFNTCNGVLYIGNGSALSSLVMDADLDLRYCSSLPIQIIINNATLDFSTANKRLFLPEGSSISFLNGGVLNPPGGNGGGCTGNDRVYLGGVAGSNGNDATLLATCQGSAGILGFDDLIALGGTGSVVSNSPVCAGNSINLSATPPPNGGPFSYSWTGPNGFTSSTQNPTITNSAQANAGQYTVVLNSSSLSVTFTMKTSVTVNPLPVAAGTISGTATVCQGQSGVSYSVPAITNATSYTWSYTGTGFTPSGTTAAITGSFSASATSGNLTVTGVNACGNGTVSATYPITVNPLPAASITPNSGPICSGANATFTLTGTSGAVVTYNINGGSTATATLTGGTATVTVTAATANQTLNLVSINNPSTSCNQILSGSSTVSVNPLPVAAGTISGTATVCQGQSGVSYSVLAITNATSYTWSYSGTGFTPSGTTASITGSFSSTATSGNLTVTGVNACGNGTVSATYAITVNPLPATPTLSVPIQPACSVATGSFTITNYNAAYTYVVSPSTGVTIAGATITAPVGGPYTVTSTLGGCTSAASLGVTLVPPGTLATPTTPTIDEASIVFPTINGNDGRVTLTNLPAGDWELTQTFVDASGNTTTTTITGSGISTTLTGLSAGSYSFEVVSITGPCISPRSSTTPALIVVPYTPLVSAATAINCTGFTANWPATPTATEYLLDVSTVSNFATFVPGYKDVKVVNALTFTVTGLPSGTWYYRIRAKNATAISLYSATITVTPLTNTYSAGSWSAGTPPTSGTENIVFNGNYDSTGDISGCSCTVTSGKVVIKSGHTMTITNAVTTNGQLIFENNASLVQTTNAVNTGAIEYQRTSAAMKNFDYTYWSSPVTGQTAKLLSPNTLWDKYFTYDPASGWVFNDGLMNPGVGFIIRTPKEGNPWPNGEIVSFPYSQPVKFIGVPNNGDIPFAVGADEYNLIGNPYPSAIDATKFMVDNSTIIYGPLYFWTHNTPITNNQYSADDYATFNLTGPTATAGNFSPEVWIDLNNNKEVNTGEYTDLNENGVLDKGLEWNDENNNNILEVGEWTDLNKNGKVDLTPVEMISNRPKGYIAAGQSFFVGNTVGGSFQFTNDMRVAKENDKFFKQASTKKTTAIEKNRVWLNLTNSQGAFKQLLVGYITGATNDWDNLYDGPTFDGQPYIDFYSINKGQNLSIQGRALPFESTDEVPLGYRSTIAGTFDISINNRDGVLASQEIWLQDKKTNTIHDLTKGKYTFTAINGVENSRFVLKYVNTTLVNKPSTNKSVLVTVKSSETVVASSGEVIAQVQVFDLLGRLVYTKSNINAQTWSITGLPIGGQALIVKTTLTNGAISSEKIIL
jgi:PKD-like domain